MTTEEKEKFKANFKKELERFTDKLENMFQLKMGTGQLKVL